MTSLVKPVAAGCRRGRTSRPADRRTAGDARTANKTTAGENDTVEGGSVNGRGSCIGGRVTCGDGSRDIWYGVPGSRLAATGWFSAWPAGLALPRALQSLAPTDACQPDGSTLAWPSHDPLQKSAIHVRGSALLTSHALAPLISCQYAPATWLPLSFSPKETAFDNAREADRGKESAREQLTVRGAVRGSSVVKRVTAGSLHPSVLPATRHQTDTTPTDKHM